MPSVGFEPRTQVFERAKTVHSSDGAATVIDFLHNNDGIKVLLTVN
jgi:hypothetical protein